MLNAYSVVNMLRQPFTRAVKIFGVLIAIASLLRFSTFLVIGILAATQDIISNRRETDIISNDPLSNIISLIWTLPDIFPLYCFILFYVVWL